MHARRLAILDDYQQVALSMADWSPIASVLDIEVFTRPFESEAQLLQALHGFEAVCLLRERTPLPRSVILQLPNLKFIGITGTHNRSLDFQTARERGIVVSHTGSGSSEHPTCELTWALILAAMRHLPQEDRALRAGKWQTTLGASIHGKTLGIVGLGRIGRRVAGIASAFGMRVAAWSPNLTPERAAQAGVTSVSKEALFQDSDIVSLHIVLSEATRGIVGAKELSSMRPGALLVNTSRGPLIDEAALLRELSAKRIRAALDVFSKEPLPQDHPLLHLDNVVLTPHLGFAVEEVYSVFYRDMVENVAAYLSGSPIRVPDVAGH